MNKLYCPTCHQHVVNADPKTYGGKLKLWRLAQRPTLSREGLGRLVGVSKHTIRKYECNYIRPRRSIRILLAREGFNSNYVEGK